MSKESKQAPAAEADSLVGATSSPAVIKKAFERLYKLLESLSNDLGKKLPKSLKPEVISADVRTP